jgi:hypothetical protein
MRYKKLNHTGELNNNLNNNNNNEIHVEGTSTFTFMAITTYHDVPPCVIRTCL